MPPRGDVGTVHGVPPCGDVGTIHGVPPPRGDVGTVHGVPLPRGDVGTVHGVPPPRGDVGTVHGDEAAAVQRVVAADKRGPSTSHCPWSASVCWAHESTLEHGLTLN